MKLLTPLMLRQLDWSRPPRGAWIETEVKECLKELIEVAPPTGRVD